MNRSGRTPNGKPPASGARRSLSQKDVDSLLGLGTDDVQPAPKSGIHLIVKPAARNPATNNESVRDPAWECHLASGVWRATLDIAAVLGEQSMPLYKVRNLKVGDTIMFDATPESDIRLCCGAVTLFNARMGRTGNAMAVRVEEKLVG